MGFFSSKRHDSAVVVSSGEDKVDLHVVRSRFYGKGKDKARPPLPLALQRPSFDRGGKLPENDMSRHPSSRTTSSVRPSTDAATMNLAQRLNELAVANEQGLLDDDEYRLLRQNLFERFANSSAIPTETPIVRHSGLGRSAVIPTSSSRPESVRSKISVTSTMSGLFKRASNRRTTTSSIIGSDSASTDSIVPSSPKIQSRSFSRRSIGRQSSQTSLSSEVSQMRSSSQDLDQPLYRLMTATNKRQSQNAPSPPSSFSSRGLGSMIRNISPHDTLNGEHTQSVKEIREEIATVEAEGRRLLDAFNGLELSALTRSQPRPLGTIPLSASTNADSDTLSVQSSATGSTSLKRSVSGRVTNSSPLISQPISLSRKNSMSSISSRGRSVKNTGVVPAMPPLPSSPLSRLGAASLSSVNLRSQSYLPLATVEEKGLPPSNLSNDPALEALENEMSDIRRRRAEVVARYEARLEFLRVRLKGAEMHEKLLKR